MGCSIYQVGSAYALYALGYYYFFRIHKAYDLMEDCYKGAMEYKIPNAFNDYAYFYETVKKDKDKAVELYSKAVSEYDALYSINNLGRIYKDNLDSNGNTQYDKMEKVLLQGIEMRCQYSTYTYGRYHKKITQDYNKMQQYYELAYKLGNMKAYYQLGVHFQYEVINYDKMKDCYNTLIAKGHVDAATKLVIYYYDIEHNTQKALELLDLTNTFSRDGMPNYYKGLIYSTISGYHHLNSTIPIPIPIREGEEPKSLEQSTLKLMEKFYTLSADLGNTKSLDNLINYYLDLISYYKFSLINDAILEVDDQYKADARYFIDRSKKIHLNSQLFIDTIIKSLSNDYTNKELNSLLNYFDNIKLYRNNEINNILYNQYKELNSKIQKIEEVVKNNRLNTQLFEEVLSYQKDGSLKQIENLYERTRNEPIKKYLGEILALYGFIKLESEFNLMTGPKEKTNSKYLREMIVEYYFNKNYNKALETYNKINDYHQNIMGGFFTCYEEASAKEKLNTLKTNIFQNIDAFPDVQFSFGNINTDVSGDSTDSNS